MEETSLDTRVWELIRTIDQANERYTDFQAWWNGFTTGMQFSGYEMRDLLSHIDMRCNRCGAVPCRCD